MSREVQVRFCESRAVQSRPATHLIVGFEHHGDAKRFLRDLRERFAKFGLELHPDKTRLVEFGRFAAERRAVRGVGKPETFDFLGFTHVCGRSKSGGFWLRRHTIKKRMRAKLRAVKDSDAPGGALAGR
jgi:RNA-directed DNA polymerase